MQTAVITGIGLVTPFGEGTSCFVQNIINQTDGITDVERFDCTHYRSNQAGQVQMVQGDILHAEYMLSVAIRESLNDAKLSIVSELKSPQFIIGTAHGNLIAWEHVIRSILENKPANSICLAKFPLWNLIQDKAKIISTACTSSTIAIGLAKHYIESQTADCVVVGGVDVLSEFVYAGFHALRALTPDKCCPFDKNRNGLVLGEGAGVLVIESKQQAIQRKAKIYAEISGFGCSSDAYHLTAPIPSGKGLETAIIKALKEAKIIKEDLGYINAHGTGTTYNDRMECTAFQRLFGSNKNPIPISSIKSAIGHTSGAAGIIEVALSALCITQNFLPATLNFKESEEEFSLDFIRKTQERNIDSVLSVNAAFGGNNAAIILKKVHQ